MNPDLFRRQEGFTPRQTMLRCRLLPDPIGSLMFASLGILSARKSIFDRVPLFPAKLRFLIP